MDNQAESVEAPKLNPTEQALDKMKRKLGDDIDSKLEEEEAEQVLEAMNNGLYSNLEDLEKDEDQELASRATFAKLTLEGVEEMWDELYEFVEQEDMESVSKRLQVYLVNFKAKLGESSIAPEKQAELYAEMEGYLSTYMKFAEDIQYEAGTVKKLGVFFLECTPVLGDGISCLNALRGKNLEGTHLSTKGRVTEMALGGVGLGLSAFTMGGGSLGTSAAKLGAKATKWAARYGDDVARVTAKGVKHGVKGIEHYEEFSDFKEATYDQVRDSYKEMKIHVDGIKKQFEKTKGTFAQLEALKAQRDELFSKIVNA